MSIPRRERGKGERRTPNKLMGGKEASLYILNPLNRILPKVAKGTQLTAGN